MSSSGGRGGKGNGHSANTRITFNLTALPTDRMSSSGGRGGKGSGGWKRPAPASSDSPAAKAPKLGGKGKGGKGKGSSRSDYFRMIDVVYQSAMTNNACLKFIHGQSCEGSSCRFGHWCYWKDGLSIHWARRDVGDLPSKEQVDSIRQIRNDANVYVLDAEETTESALAPVAPAPTFIVIDEAHTDEVKPVKKSSSEILKPSLRLSEWEREKKGLLTQIASLEHKKGAPNLKEGELSNIEKRINRANAKLLEGERRCAARDNLDDVRCGRADEGLPKSTASEFRYVLVPAKSWEVYDSADDEAIPGAIDQGNILESHNSDQVQSMKWLFYQLVQGLARPEGDRGKKGQFIPPPSC